MKRQNRTWLLVGALWVVVSGTAILSAQADARQNALALEQQGQNAEAEQAWQSITSSNPQSLPLRLTLAHSCLWSKQYQCVLDVYKEILALNAESAEADMLVGEALDEKGDDAGATEQFRAAVRSNPKEPNAHYGLAYLLWTQNHFQEAAKEFQAELDNDPQHLQARAYLGDTYVQLSDYGKALPELKKALVADNSIALVHRDLGIVYAEEGRKDDAISELQKAIELDPKDVTPHWRLARLYQSTGKKEEAKAEFAKASTMNIESMQASQALYQKLAEAHEIPQP